MTLLDRRTAKILLTILLFAVVLAIAYAARGVLVVFAFATLFAYLIDPVVRFLQRHSLFFKNLRGPHILEAYLGFLIVIAVAPHVVAPGLLEQTRKVLKEVPTMVDDLLTGEIATKLGDKYGWTDDQQYRLKSFLAQHRTEIQGLWPAAARLTPTVASLVLIPILAIFFLSDGANLANSLIRLVSSGENVDAVQSLARDLNVALLHYIRAKVILGGLSFAYCSTVMLVLGFPYTWALGVLAGILEFIPLAGWKLSATIIITVGVVTHSPWIWMAVLLGCWRMLMDYAIAPRVMGHELEIHPCWHYSL
jgi:predicted PurR-regulated permease PerM